ncbi:MAG: FecCD family ABC transporter permease [Aeromonadaceae bacterium]
MVRTQTCFLLTTVLLLPLLGLLSMATGAGVYGASELFGYALGDHALLADDKLVMIIETLRLPRTLCALFVGVALAAAATLLQSATRNPLAEPGLLGVNAGAVLGLITGLTYAGIASTYGYLLWSGLGALLGNLLVLGLGSLFGAGGPLRLILVGVAINAIFGGLSSFLLMSNQVVLDQFRFWDLGSLAAAELESLWLLLPVLLLGLVLALLLSRALALLQMGDAQARALGLRPTMIRTGVLLAATLMTASAVSLAGPIGFLGFLAAYLGRQLDKSHIPRQLLFSTLCGALLLLSADILARWLIQPFELPVGTLLALLGAPILIGVIWHPHTNTQLGSGAHHEQ